MNQEQEFRQSARDGKEHCEALCNEESALYDDGEECNRKSYTAIKKESRDWRTLGDLPRLLPEPPIGDRGRGESPSPSLVRG